MADGTSGLITSRSHFDVVNRQKITVFFDFAYAEFFALDTFFTQLRRIQGHISREEKIVIEEQGIEVDLSNVGGLMALQIHLQDLEATRSAMTGLSALGLRIENKLLQLQQAG